PATPRRAHRPCRRSGAAARPFDRHSQPQRPRAEPEGGLALYRGDADAPGLAGRARHSAGHGRVEPGRIGGRVPPAFGGRRAGREDGLHHRSLVGLDPGGGHADRRRAALRRSRLTGMALIPNRTLARLRAGTMTIGFGVNHLRTAAIPQMAAAAGYDWLM